MSTPFFLDIETQRTQDPAVIARLRDSVSPPGNISKPETIAAWWKERGAAARMEAVNKTALDGTYGSLATIGSAIGDSDVVVLSLDPTEFTTERALLSAFSGLLTNQQSVEIVAFNGEFDLRFLMKRFVINNLHVPFRIQAALTTKGGFYDPMHAWEGYRGYISQAELEKVLGITRNDDIDGSQVAEALDAGDWQRVVNHNKEDIQSLRQIYQRLSA